MKNIKTFFSMFRKLVQILDRKQKRQAVFLFFLLLIVSVLEMLGVSVIVPFIITMLEPDKIMSNEYVAPIIEALSITDYRQMMYLVTGGIILAYVAKNAFILSVNYYQSNYRNRLEKDLDVRMLASYMKRPYTFFLNTNSSDILRGINTDIASVASVVDGYSGICAEGLTCVIIGVFLICMNPVMALSLLIVAGATALIIILGFKKRTGKSGELCREAFSEKFKDINHAVYGIKEITVANKREYFVEQFAKAAQKAADSNTRYLWISKAPSRLLETAFIGGLLIVVTIAHNRIGNNVTFITQLGAMGIAAVRILPSISSLTNAMNSLVYLRPSLEAAYENLIEADNYQKSFEVQKEGDIVRQIEFTDKISVENVAWRYQKDLPWVLKGVSLEIHRGEAVALIGESGAGKSTLADVLLGLLHPEKGTITVDGTDIYSIPAAWSGIIGYVPQMVFLTDDTIRNNVAFGVPEEEIDDARVWEVLKQAQMEKVVEGLKDGLASIVGERGISLSGGQRQRIAIARALYHNPEIMVLDEATSALDSETEGAIMEAIDILKGRKTLIIIAHRLSTIRNCDKIYEITEGKAVLKEHSVVFGE